MLKRILELALDKKIQRDTVKSSVLALSFMNRVIDIKENPNLRNKFTAGEIACSLFNFDLAMQNLSDQEFSRVMDVYEHYLFSGKTLKLNYAEFLDYCLKVIESYNAVAPYSKFSGFEQEIN